MKQSFNAAAASFAHLLGRAEKTDQRADDDEDMRDDEENKKVKKSKRAEKDDKEDKKRESDDEAASEEDDDVEAEDDQDDTKDEPNDKDSKKSRKAKRAEKDDGSEDDDDDEKELKGNSPAASARCRERARCAAIFADKSAANRPDVAAHLAFDTALPRQQAIALLRAVSSGGDASVSKGRSFLSERMASLKIPNVGTDASASTKTPADDTAEKIVAAGKKRRGEI